MLAPAQLVEPLLKLPFLSPLAAYALILTRLGEKNMTAAAQPLLTWMRVFLKVTTLGVSSLDALDL